jgi:hypothetical protein
MGFVQSLRERRVSVWRAAILGLCVLFLLIGLANRVPRFAAVGDATWVRAVPSETTAKLLIKDLCLLQPSRLLSFVAHSFFAVRRAEAQRHVVYLAPVDDRLYNRPPPSLPGTT